MNGVKLYADFVNNGNYCFDGLAPHKELAKRGFVQLDENGDVKDFDKLYITRKSDTGKTYKWDIDDY